MTSTLTGRLHALEVDETGYYAYIYKESNKPEREEISPAEYRMFAKQYGDYLVYRDFVGAYEYRAYSVNAQIEADWQHEEAEVRDYRQTVDALSRENA